MYTILIEATSEIIISSLGTITCTKYIHYNSLASNHKHTTVLCVYIYIYVCMYQVAHTAKFHIEI